MTDPTHPASRAQIAAANPARSVWLSANAGAGKTRVLTGRVAWLMLQGVAPERILCLTYTKAAAGEMQNRLFAQLGGWAMQDDGALRAELAAMGVPTEGMDTRQLNHARTLFARAIEAPGGLKIQTIHAFCAALLRRFPLEAGVSPHFTELDERTKRLMIEEALDAMADGPEVDVLDAVLTRLSDQSAEGLCRAILDAREAFAQPQDRDALFGAFEVSPDLTLADLPDKVLTPQVLRMLQDMRAALPLDKGKAMAKLADSLAPVSFEAPSEAALAALMDTIFTQKQELRSAPVTKKIREALGEETIEALQEAALEALHLRQNLIAAERTWALHAFARPFLARIDAAKTARSLLDFDDMIHRTRALLSRRAVAQWVLYRLDGGIDHILVDEAQDTSPAQWEVITALTQEFYAHAGAVSRRMFVVGDKKQSIYSFQGADAAQFDAQRDRFQRRFEAAGADFAPLELHYSFRSAPAVLRFVDQVFASDGTPGIGAGAQHQAFFAAKPGRVTLWDPIEAVPKTKEERAWHDPVDQVAQNHHHAVMGRQVAARIKAMLEARHPIATKDGPRPIAPGDILILVQRRRGVFQQIIAACKALGLPLAGADVLKIGGEVAVRDLTALLKFLALPEDDLSLAVVLRSPLLGWSEDALFRLAHNRGRQSLWQRLRANAAAHPDTVALLRDLRDHADFLRPYEVLERVLTRHQGRKRLLSRLGQEAEEGIDALLTQAMAYERVEIPSVDGFLTWMEADEVQIKRQPDTQGGLIRVMTVHGAKGLEAPVVILPETEARRPPDSGILVPGPRGVMAWKPIARDCPAALRDAAEARRIASQEERDRLFYVAMTRAESWLILGAAGNLGKAPQDSWFGLAEQAITALGATRTDQGRELIEGDWSPLPEVAAPPPDTEQKALPDWVRTQPKTPATAPGLVRPSDLGGDKVIWGDAPEGLARDAAMSRGHAVHLLLEHLPALPPPEWAAAAQNILAAQGVPPEAQIEMIAEARHVLEAPHLAHVFGPETLSEVPFTGPPLPGTDAPIYGVLDRLILTPGHALVVDFKTNAQVPARAQDTPLGLLRQMGAYGHGLAAIYPDRQIQLAILWTRTAELMTLPPDLLAQALRAPLDG